MKTKILKTALLIGGIALVLPLSALAQKANMKYTFYVAYDAEEVIRDQSQVATILAGEGLEVDGVTASTETMRYANHTPSRPNFVVVDVTPGRHKVRVLNHVSGGTIVMEPIEFNFEAGKVYRMGIKILSMVVEEHPNEKIKGQIDTIRKSAEYQKPRK